MKGTNMAVATKIKRFFAFTACILLLSSCTSNNKEKEKRTQAEEIDISSNKDLESIDSWTKERKSQSGIINGEYVEFGYNIYFIDDNGDFLLPKYNYFDSKFNEDTGVVSLELKFPKGQSFKNKKLDDIITLSWKLDTNNSKLLEKSQKNSLNEDVNIIEIDDASLVKIGLKRQKDLIKDN